MLGETKIVTIFTPQFHTVMHLSLTPLPNVMEIVTNFSSYSKNIRLILFVDMVYSLSDECTFGFS